jgi:hypothetical protein
MEQWKRNARDYLFFFILKKNRKRNMMQRGLRLSPIIKQTRTGMNISALA